eukprot:2651965-Rhodomonas_salina.2
MIRIRGIPPVTARVPQAGTGIVTESRCYYLYRSTVVPTGQAGLGVCELQPDESETVTLRVTECRFTGR